MLFQNTLSERGRLLFPASAQLHDSVTNAVRLPDRDVHEHQVQTYVLWEVDFQTRAEKVRSEIPDVKHNFVKKAVERDSDFRWQS
jgi:hypothetical protein